VKSKKLFIILGLVAGIGIAAGLVVVFVLKPFGPPAEPVGVRDPAEGEHGVMLALEERVVNLAPGGKYSYAKIGITVEIRPEKEDFYAAKGEPRKLLEDEAIKGFGPAMPLLLDAVGRAVSSKTSDELATPEGRTALKETVRAEVVHILGEAEVLDIYFTDLVMQ
jgi:flagellar basal body-associated protein FliL